MRTKLVAVCLATLAAFFAPYALGQESATTWGGTLNANGVELRLQVRIDRAGDALTGELTSLDQGNAKLALADITFSETELTFTVSQIAARFSGKLTENGTVATGEYTQGGARLALTLTRTDAHNLGATERLREAWFGKLSMGVLKPVMQFRIVDLADGTTKAYFDSITEGRTGFDGTWSREGDKLTFDIPAIRLSFTGTLNEAGDLAQGSWRQGGRELPLALERSETEYRNAKIWENRPQRPRPPFPYDVEEVRFDNAADEITLAGTLTIPAGDRRHPAVVLISGSGPQDRDEFFMEHRPFLVLADYLTRNGIAVLRYDDRGTAQSTGRYAGATIEAFARDASAAVEFLKSHGRIDERRIGLAGHSEGGVVAPIVANARDDVAFVVLMAGTAVDGRTVLLSQSEAMLRASNMAEESEIELAQAISSAMIGTVMDGTPGADLTDEIMGAVEAVIATIPEAQRETAGAAIRGQARGEIERLQSDWMRHFLSYDPAPALRELDVPVLAIIGTKDLQVIPDVNVPAMRAALARNENAMLIELNGLNHLFQTAETGSIAEYVEIDETINAAALNAVTEWITSRFACRTGGFACIQTPGSQRVDAAHATR